MSSTNSTTSDETAGYPSAPGGESSGDPGTDTTAGYPSAPGESSADHDAGAQQRTEGPEHIENVELVAAGSRQPATQEQDGPTEVVSEPAKVMRIGSMVKQLLEEVRAAPLDQASRERLAAIHERSVIELGQALSPDLQSELRNLALPFTEGVPSDAELRIAQAQLVGWLEGLFHGIQATLFAQQIAARQQLEQMRQLPPGHMPGSPGGPPAADRPGTYL